METIQFLKEMAKSAASALAHSEWHGGHLLFVSLLGRPNPLATVLENKLEINLYEVGDALRQIESPNVFPKEPQLRAETRALLQQARFKLANGTEKELSAKEILQFLACQKESGLFRILNQMNVRAQKFCSLLSGNNIASQPKQLQLQIETAQAQIRKWALESARLKMRVAKKLEPYRGLYCFKELRAAISAIAAWKIYFWIFKEKPIGESIAFLHFYGKCASQSLQFCREICQALEENDRILSFGDLFADWRKRGVAAFQDRICTPVAILKDIYLPQDQQLSQEFSFSFSEYLLSKGYTFIGTSERECDFPSLPYIGKILLEISQPFVLMRRNVDTYRIFVLGESEDGKACRMESGRMIVDSEIESEDVLIDIAQKTRNYQRGYAKILNKKFTTGKDWKVTGMVLKLEE